MKKRVLWLGLSFLLVTALVLTSCIPADEGQQEEEEEEEEEGESVTPTPGVNFTGPILISGKASSGAIKFRISEDRASITFVAITLKDLKSDGFSAESINKEVSGSFPVIGGSFDASIAGIGEIEGHFTSPRKAIGTINITLEIPLSEPLELGEWGWSARYTSGFGR